MPRQTKTFQKESAHPGRYNLYRVSLALALVAFSASAYLALDGRPTGWEVTLLSTINGWPESWYHFFTFVTFFGSTWAALLAVVTTFVFRLYRLAWRLSLTIIGAYAVTYLAKQFIGRERPIEILTNIHARAVETGMGFPSGHAALSAVIAGTLWPYLPPKARWVIVPSFIGLICLSRLYLGVHFPLDLVGGMAIGIGAVSLLRVLPGVVRSWLRIS